MKKKLIAAAAGLGVLALAAPAYAHVTVSADGATRGGSDQQITFRVPVEKNIDTVGLKITLPTNTPIADIMVLPVPGWTHTEKTAKLASPIHTDDGDITEAVSEVDWTAQTGHGLAPGEFGEFTIIAGQLPDAASLTFPTTQTYADGSQVLWNQVAAPGTDEPENPAPTLTLAAADATTAPAASKSSSSDTTSRTLAIVALALGAAALSLSVINRAKREPTSR